MLVVVCHHCFVFDHYCSLVAACTPITTANIFYEGIGGESSSLAVNYSQTAAFHSAGYADIRVNNSYIGGQVRQYGNFSFSRVYQAGHEVPAYQPEAAYRIFQRAIFGKDIATGQVDTETTPGYSSRGSPTTFQVKNKVPKPPPSVCYILDLDTCTDDEFNAVLDGSALVRDYIVVNENTTRLFPGLLGNITTSSRTGQGNRTTSGTATAYRPSQTGSADTLLSSWAAVFIGVGIAVWGIN